jgi:hypothetical protein
MIFANESFRKFMARIELDLDYGMRVFCMLFIRQEREEK